MSDRDHSLFVEEVSKYLSMAQIGRLVDTDKQGKDVPAKDKATSELSKGEASENQGPSKLPQYKHCSKETIEHDQHLQLLFNLMKEERLVQEPKFMQKDKSPDQI